MLGPLFRRFLSSLLAPIPSRWGLFFSWAVVGGCNLRQGRSVLQSTPVAYLPHRGTSEHLSNQLLTPPGLFPRIPHAQFPRRTHSGNLLAYTPIRNTCSIGSVRNCTK